MKLITIALSILIFASCGGKKEVASSTSSAEATTASASTNAGTSSSWDGVHDPENLRIIGTVRVDDSACKLWIDAQPQKDKHMKLYPINLDEKFKKDGMMIKFTYAVSRAPQPGGCDAQLVIKVEDVTPLRDR